MGGDYLMYIISLIFLRIFGLDGVGNKELVRLLGTTFQQMSGSRFGTLTPTEEATIDQSAVYFLYCHQFQYLTKHPRLAVSAA